MKKVIATAAAPAALGPYNQAIAYGDLLFVSGQTARYPAGVTATRPESAAEQMRVALNNVMEILHAGGSDAAHILKTTVFLTDMADFESVNAVYKEFISEPFPARTCITVKELPKGAKAEIEVIAACKKA